jgi:hypothetical protein
MTNKELAEILLQNPDDQCVVYDDYGIQSVVRAMRGRSVIAPSLNAAGEILPDKHGYMMLATEQDIAAWRADLEASKQRNLKQEYDALPADLYSSYAEFEKGHLREQKRIEETLRRAEQAAFATLLLGDA